MNKKRLNVFFSDWRNDRGVDRKLSEMTDMELDQVLRRFYAEARAKDGELYSRSSLLAIRNAIERFLNNPPHNRAIKIAKGEAFQLSNKMLNSKIKVQKKDGKENIKHKPAIPPGDLRKLSASGVIHGGTPLGLLRNVWFNTSLYWCRRGREGQRELRADSFVFEVDEDCRPYARMNVDEVTKNHPGGIVDVQSSEKFGRMYQTSSDPNLDGLSCLKKYISKRNASCEAFFQYPKRKGAEVSDVVWYENRPLGVNKLQSMMRDISKAAALSQIYTNHSVRATAITLWSDAQISSRHIMNISGHRNEESIKHYNTRPSSSQLRQCSDVLSAACSSQNTSNPLMQDGSHVSPPEPLQLSVVPVANKPSTQPFQRQQLQQNSPFQILGSGGMFNSCQIQNINVFVNKDP